MEIAASSLGAEASYKLLVGAVVPRPIAWITTLNAQGGVNLAPFSAFTYVSVKPPMLGINCGRKAGVMKDTGTNILASREFVVHIADAGLVGPVHESSTEYPPEVSEVAELGLEVLPCVDVRVPRLAIAPIAMECRFHSSTPFGATGSAFIVGEVLRFHIRDGLCVDGKIDTRTLQPLCRLGGPNYATIGELIRMQPVAYTAKSVIEG
ncbi:MAG: flavin reductase family protein [Burkholderiales bacterium]